jgi:hypothetical protein
MAVISHEFGRLSPASPLPPPFSVLLLASSFVFVLRRFFVSSRFCLFVLRPVVLCRCCFVVWFCLSGFCVLLSCPGFVFVRFCYCYSFSWLVVSCFRGFVVWLQFLSSLLSFCCRRLVVFQNLQHNKTRIRHLIHHNLYVMSFCSLFMIINYTTINDNSTTNNINTNTNNTNNAINY